MTILNEAVESHKMVPKSSCYFKANKNVGFFVFTRYLDLLVVV